MRLFIAAILLLSVGGALIFYHCANNGQSEIQIEQDQPTASTLSPAVHQPQTKNEAAKPYDAGKDCLYRLYLFATIAGVFAALGGIYAIYSQTEATRQAAEATARSAKATEDGISLQQASLRQWVNIEHWEVWMDKRTSTLRLRFHIVNPTELPLDLHSIDLTTSVIFVKEQPHHETVSMSESLAPKNPYICDISDVFSDDETTKLVELEDEAALHILVEGIISFTDNASRHWEQQFERAVYFGKAELFALKEYDKLPPSVRQFTNHLTEKKRP